MCHEEVGLQDAVVAVVVMECSMQGSALLQGINILHSMFPSDADEEYSLQGEYGLDRATAIVYVSCQMIS